MAEQNAQDINQMMSASPEVAVAAPKKSKFLWIVLGCVVVGVGLGVVVYQQSVKTAVKPGPTPKTAVVVTPKPSPIASPIETPVTPGISLVEAEPKTVAFPKGGKLRVYYWMGSWMSAGIIAKDATSHNFTIPAGTPTTTMKVFDTGYDLPAAATLSIDSYLGSNSSQLSIGWAKPAGNNCGFNGFGLVDLTAQIAYATEQAKGEPLVSIQCWGDYSPNPADTSAKDFNDYVMIWSYTPPTTAASASPSASVKASASPSPSASAKASVSPSPSASAKASATATATPTPTPNTSPRVSMPDTSEGTPVTGIFEVTVGTVSIGLLLLILGLFGLLAL